MFKIKSKKMAVHKKYNNGTKSNALGRGLDAPHLYRGSAHPGQQYHQ